MIQKLLIFYIILLIITDKGYIDYLPTIPIYKNNEKEAELVKVLSDNRTENDIKFFNLTNEYVIYAYLPYVNESKDESGNPLDINSGNDFYVTEENFDDFRNVFSGYRAKRFDNGFPVQYYKIKTAENQSEIEFYDAPDGSFITDFRWN